MTPSPNGHPQGVLPPRALCVQAGSLAEHAHTRLPGRPVSGILLLRPHLTVHLVGYRCPLLRLVGFMLHVEASDPITDGCEPPVVAGI